MARYRYEQEELDHMQRKIFAGIAITCFLGASTPIFGELASATYSVSPISLTNFQYDLTLDDIGTTNIGTFWFAWTPGEDFMPFAPANVLSPAGWTFNITGFGTSDGRAIQWVASPSSLLTPGESLSGFQFDSMTTPAQMAGPSLYFNNPPVTTSFVYAGLPLSDPGFEFVAVQQAETPEPTSLYLFATVLLALFIGNTWRVWGKRTARSS